MERKFIVAVYGTLKRGFYNHYYLKNATFLGKAISKNRFILGHYSYPAVVPGKEGAPIEVEIYEVSKETFKNLDQLEDYPTFYTRSKETFILSNKNIEAFIYYLPEEHDLFLWLKPNSNTPYLWTKRGWIPVK